MSTRTRRDPRTGQMVECEILDIASIDDPPIVITLKDGTILRLRMDIFEVLRIPGGYDNEGNPLFQTRHAGLMSVVYAPPETKDPQRT